MTMKFYVAENPHQTILQINEHYIEQAIALQRLDPKQPAIELIFGKHASNSSLVVTRAFIDLMNYKGVYFRAQRSGDAFGYANRIGFFSDFKNVEYEYQKHDASGRFIEIEKIEQHDVGVADRVKKALDEYSVRPGIIISPEAHEILLYSIGELISNVRRHAHFSGRVSFQYYPKKGINEITVCDCGIGIINSMKNAYQASDQDLLKMSIQKGITSSITYGPYSERSPGVGLFNLCKLAEQNINAQVTIYTKNFRMIVNSRYPVENPLIDVLECSFPGTMVCVSIPNLVNVDLQTIMKQTLKGHQFIV